MPKNITYAFHNSLILLPLTRILLTRKIDKVQEQSVKFKSIFSSVKEIGIIEPLVVYPEGEDFILLDGHLRLLALKNLGKVDTLCLISTDDESFTYNKQINRLTTIQEHKMLVKAIERGVSTELIAKTLNVNIESLKTRVNLLNGISKVVVTKLADKQVSKDIFRILRKMKPERQIEAVDMMIASNKYSSTYANMMLAASQPNELVAEKKKNSSDPVLGLAIIEKEMTKLKRNYKISEEKLAELNLSLVVAQGYINKLLKNQSIVSFLKEEYVNVYEALFAISEK
ncbi:MULTISPECIES: plasmid partitioning protein RepB C-terminal domain-containing protein [Providencia]|uniref:plasmid partitioning protein RepB C-terminal domain-containing protein n=1 Tax=Providencia TaxID=586 RepID=UPI0021D4BE80|nr:MULTISPECIES: plasmid partitioning protein RepB C-terminal domain-containing protein [Providencia]WIE09321.1 plasmid partitioning protein RepB C-terminal domain-containing protein [Providencia rettgeri]